MISVVVKNMGFVVPVQLLKGTFQINKPLFQLVFLALKTQKIELFFIT